jgi:hypothetical protein
VASRFNGAAVEGEREAIAAFKRLPDVSKEHLGDATDRTTFAILQRAGAKVRVRYGFLKRALDRNFNKKTGVGAVGIRKGAAYPLPKAGDGNRRRRKTTAYPGKYGHLVEFGGPKSRPYPFMVPAAEAEREPYLNRCREAGKKIEKSMEHVGGGRL